MPTARKEPAVVSIDPAVDADTGTKATADTVKHPAKHGAPLPDIETFTPGGPSITEAEPDTVQMTQANAAQIRASTVQMQQSAAGRVSGSRVHLEQGASGLVRATEARITEGAVGALAADTVEFQNGFALLVLARQVTGNVTVLLDWRGLAAVLVALLALGRMRGRR